METGNEDESWDASMYKNGSAMAHRTGTEIIIVNNNMSKSLFANMDSSLMFSGFTGLLTLNMSGLSIARTAKMSNAFSDCIRLKTIILGPKFKFIGTDGYLPAPTSSYIEGADGRWYDIIDGVGYTPASLGSSTWTEERTYTAVKPENVTTALSPGSSWYKSSMNRNTITKISLINTYTPTGNEDEFWDASAAQDGSYMAYRIDKEIILVGDGSGIIKANPDSSHAFSFVIYTNPNTVTYSSAFTSLTMIEGLNLLDTSNVTNMSYMFRSCKALQALDLSGWNTSKVVNMNDIFGSCEKLTELNLLGWNTSKVIYMSNIFDWCIALKSIDITGWDTSKAINMNCMFRCCRNLTSIDVSHFDTSNVTNMWGMFFECNNLAEIDLSNFNTSKVRDMSYMFDDCYKLTELDLSGWDMSNVTNMYCMYYQCYRLQRITLGTKYKYIGANAHLPRPSSTYIPGADGKWYDTKDGVGYTLTEVESMTRTEPRTYVAIKPTVST